MRIMEQTFRKIEFQPSSKPFSNGNVATKVSNVVISKSTAIINSSVSTKSLFAEEIVLQCSNWSKISQAGPGLYNHGNTCFLNSALQCLIHTPPLAQILLNENKCIEDILNKSGQQRNSMLVFLRSVIVHAWSDNSISMGHKKAISPIGIVQNIRCIGKHFRPGRYSIHYYPLKLIRY